MCMVSAVMDYGQRAWPNTLQPNWTPNMPLGPFGPLTQPPTVERDAIKRFMEAVEKAEAFDKAAKQPHCEDPEKIKLLARIEQRLEAIEKQLGLTA